MESTMRNVPRSISVFTLAMINVAAICSVKNWPLTAEYGFSALFFLLVGALIFLLPVSLISAELATGWPKIGGVYVWVKEAFGHRSGFLAAWLLWIENVIWYPTILSFIAATLAYFFNPELAQNTFYNVAVIFVAFWGMTLVNLLGMRASGLISTIGAIAGTLIPGILIIILGFIWFFQGMPLQITLDWASLIPNMSQPKQLVFFSGVLLSFAGMEMSAIHARDVRNPQKDYPRSIFLSAFVIVFLSTLGILSIASVVPKDDITLTGGSMQAFTIFLSAYNLSSWIPVIALLVFFGALGSMSTWIVGPTKGLLAAAQGGDLPPFMRKVNHKGMPVPLLFMQAGIVTVLSLLFFLMPSVNSAFWLLMALVAQVYLIMYLIMFAAAIRLRYTKPHVPRAYRVPGGKKWGMWCIAGLGIVGALLTFTIGFFPPDQITTGSPTFYISFMTIGIIFVCLAPSLILRFKKESWNHPPKE